MRLSELENYSHITIQCHDNPDGDAIGAGYALFDYFQKRNKDVLFIYSGELAIQKSNLVMLLEKLRIPLLHVASPALLVEHTEFQERICQDGRLKGLLLMVDCQYGAGNATKFLAEEIAVIDHHEIENQGMPLSKIQHGLGSCCTLVWNMMREEGYSFEQEKGVGTALYYGLYSDTNQFAEISNPLDRDMRDELPYSRHLINQLRNSNISLRELEVASIAMLRTIFNDDYHYALIKAQPCDPNILGLISDFLIQVDTIHTCIVYHENEKGYKISVRSCIKEVRASELASFVTKGLGSGGGHTDKAGGYISNRLYDKFYPTMHTEAYFSQKFNEYFESTDIIYGGTCRMDTTHMQRYVKKQIPLGFVCVAEILPMGTPITIRTLEGDIDLAVADDFYVMIGIKGEVYPLKKEKFYQVYREISPAFSIQAEYMPTIRNQSDGTVNNIMDYAHTCMSTGERQVFAKELQRAVKIFTMWDKETYVSGKVGDFLAVRSEDPNDIFIVEREVFFQTYEMLD